MAMYTEFVQRGGWWVVIQIPALILAVALPPWSSPVADPPGDALQWAGLFLAVVGAAWFGVALATLAWRRALTPFPRPLGRARLATGGVYRCMRHPVYTGVVVGTFGWSVLWWSVAGVGYTIALAVFFNYKARREERWLRDQFPEYADYARRVRRFIPGVF